MVNSVAVPVVTAVMKHTATINPIPNHLRLLNMALLLSFGLGFIVMPLVRHLPKPFRNAGALGSRQEINPQYWAAFLLACKANPPVHVEICAGGFDAADARKYK
jgi:hypothetical protein